MWGHAFDESNMTKASWRQRFLSAMKKRPRLQQHQPQDLELLKAVAQAWYSHSGTSKPMSEFDARRRNFKGNPSRFKLEALNKQPSSSRDTYWDFQQSLWDSYELVTVSRRIEAGLTLDNPFDELCGSTPIQPRRKPESKNSLRNLFNFMSSRRFNAPNIKHLNDTWLSSSFSKAPFLITLNLLLIYSMCTLIFWVPILIKFCSVWTLKDALGYWYSHVTASLNKQG